MCSGEAVKISFCCVVKLLCCGFGEAVALISHHTSTAVRQSTAVSRGHSHYSRTPHPYHITRGSYGGGGHTGA
jgi:hypothetical protein